MRGLVVVELERARREGQRGQEQEALGLQAWSYFESARHDQLFGPRRQGLGRAEVLASRSFLRGPCHARR